LQPGDSASYRFQSGKESTITLTARGPGSLSLRLGLWQKTLKVLQGWQKLQIRYSNGGGGESALNVTCINGEAMLDDIDVQ
jgi:hypothetical protein